jgi:hypothetical protein
MSDTYWIQQAIKFLKEAKVTAGAEQAQAELDALTARLAHVEAERDAAVLLRKGISTLLADREAQLAEADQMLALTRRVHAQAVQALIDNGWVLDEVCGWYRPADSAPAVCSRCNGHGVVPDLRGDQPCPECSAPAVHQHTEECWEPDSGCDMGRNEKYARMCSEDEAKAIDAAVRASVKP